MSRLTTGRALGVSALLAGALGLTACSGTSSGTSAQSAGDGTAAVSMATSISTAQDSWAVVPMASDPAFWQVFVRSANSGSWRLVTPPGIADNGGLVASASGPSSLSVVVRANQDLAFSPLTATANAGASWSTGGLIDASVAASPDALAASGGKLVALLGNGTVETSSDAGTSWSVIAKPGAIAASPAGKGCGGAVLVTSVSFGLATIGPVSTDVLAGGTCGAGGAALFSYAPGAGWQRVSLPVSGQLLRLSGVMALVQGKSGLSALWRGTGWYAYAGAAGTPQPAPTNWSAPAALPVSGTVTASGTLASGGAWVLLPGGRAATIGGPGKQWVLLPPVPAHTAVLASGPGGATDALAVSGETLTVWRLAAASTVWTRAETIRVPIQYGSSS